jgi:hypothetical protein
VLAITSKPKKSLLPIKTTSSHSSCPIFLCLPNSMDSKELGHFKSQAHCHSIISRFCKTHFDMEWSTLESYMRKWQSLFNIRWTMVIQSLMSRNMA